jgi:hypothetical protein
MNHLLDCEHVKLGKCKLYLKNDKSELILITAGKTYSGDTDQIAFGTPDLNNPEETNYDIFPIKHIHKLKECKILYYPTDRAKVNLMISGDFIINGELKSDDALMYSLDHEIPNEVKSDTPIKKTRKEDCLFCNETSRTVTRCCFKCNELFMDLETQLEREFFCEEHREPVTDFSFSLKLCDNCIKNGFAIIKSNNRNTALKNVKQVIGHNIKHFVKKNILRK